MFGDWQVREAAVEAIAMIGSPAVDLLLRYVRDYDARKPVIKTLGKINDERVLDPLISLMRNDEFKDDATWALAELGKPAVGRLLELLKMTQPGRWPSWENPLWVDCWNY
jgi:HEAT repeat protein